MKREELEREIEKTKNSYNYHWNEQLDCQRKIRLLEGELQRMDKKEGKTMGITKEEYKMLDGEVKDMLDEACPWIESKFRDKESEKNYEEKGK